MKNQEYDWLLREKYHGEKSEAFGADCARLEAGEPFAYIIGSIPFLDCTIHLDSHPLIPRPETEWWAEQAITTIKDNIMSTPLGHITGERSLTSNLPPTFLEPVLAKSIFAAEAPKKLVGDSPCHILDLCAGSGAIGVAVAKAIPEAVVTFAEIDPNHLPTIRKNLATNIPNFTTHESQYQLIASDLFTDVSGTYDFILTNPPYIDHEAGTVDESVIHHEPHLALFGGIAGMEVIEKIIREAKQHLTPQTGQLWIEHEPFQVAAIETLAYLHDFVVKPCNDQYGTVRYSILTLPVAK